MEAMTHRPAGQLQSFYRQLPGIRVSPEDVPLLNCHRNFGSVIHSSERSQDVAEDV